jgi:hypothetical protein
LSDQDVVSLSKSIEYGSPLVIARTVGGINAIRQQFIDKLLNEIKQQCKKLCARSSPSVLRKNGFSGMTEFDWPNLISEMATNCPLLLDVILGRLSRHKKKCL